MKEQKERKTLLQKREELKMDSLLLHKMAYDKDIPKSKSYEIMQKQNEAYKKFVWMDKYIKAERKVNND